MIKNALFCVSTVLVLLGSAGCTSMGVGSSSADYQTGSDSARIKDLRNGEASTETDAELAQHRRQRADVSEEMDLEEKKRNATMNNILAPFQVAHAIGIY